MFDWTQEKHLHHLITTGAALANWHAQMLGLSDMRPGIEPPDALTQQQRQEGETL